MSLKCFMSNLKKKKKYSDQQNIYFNGGLKVQMKKK